MILTTFLVMMSLKPGFSDGITGFYMYAEWDKLADTKVRQEFHGKNIFAVDCKYLLQVWVAACTQIFYSLGVGVGSQLLLCSYNKVSSKESRQDVK